MACTAKKLCVQTHLPAKSLSLTEALRWFLQILHKPAPPLAVVSNVKATRARTKTPLRLSCNADFIIVDVHPELCYMLRYEPHEMIGLSVFELMSPVVADAHASTLRRLKKASTSERLQAMRCLRHLRCRDSIVLDAQRNAVACRLTVQLRVDLSSELVFHEIQGKLPHSVPRGFGQYIRQTPELHLVDAKEVACIMTDLANTTSFSTQQPPRVMAELLHKVYVTANAVVEREALPYVYIHEIVGDSLLLLCNADFMARHPGRTAAIGIYVAKKVQTAVDEMLKEFSDHDMYLRVGIASGPICAGVVDGRSFRVFGSTIHLSQRLESMCPRGHIACCANFTKQLRHEVPAETMRLSECTAELKGLGQVDYTVVDFSGSQLPGSQARI